MNIQDKMQEIHHKYGVTEKANYEIQLFVEALLKEQKEQLILSGVVKSLPDRNEITKKGFSKAGKHKNKNSKVNKIDYGFGFIDGAEWMKEILNK